MSELAHKPTWLTAAIDQRVAYFQEKAAHGKAIPRVDLVVMMLTEPEPNTGPLARKRWEHACDNCDRFCPDTLENGHVNLLVNGQRVTITFGSCPACLALP